jgi:hypothetical protein
MKTTVNEFSLGLIFWQVLVLFLLLFIIYIVYKIVKKYLSR